MEVKSTDIVKKKKKKTDIVEYGDSDLETISDLEIFFDAFDLQTKLFKRVYHEVERITEENEDTSADRGALERDAGIITAAWMFRMLRRLGAYGQSAKINRWERVREWFKCMLDFREKSSRLLQDLCERRKVRTFAELRTDIRRYNEEFQTDETLRIKRKLYWCIIHFLYIQEVAERLFVDHEFLNANSEKDIGEVLSSLWQKIVGEAIFADAKAKGTIAARVTKDAVRGFHQNFREATREGYHLIRYKHFELHFPEKICRDIPNWRTEESARAFSRQRMQQYCTGVAAIREYVLRQVKEYPGIVTNGQGGFRFLPE